MPARRRPLLLPTVVLTSLIMTSVPATAASATAASATAVSATAAPVDQSPSVSPAARTGPSKKITGIVQTVIRERPRGHRTDADSTADADADADDTIKVLRVGTKTVPLTEGSLPTTRDGATVSVTVSPAADGTQQVLSATPISPAVTADTPSTHQVYVALMVPAGMSADASITDASTRTMVTKVSQYWASQTGDKVSFATAQVLPYQSAYACGNTYDMWSEALVKMPNASGPGKHLVVVAPRGADSSGCDYGLGSIGSVTSSGNQVFVSGLNQSLLAHELGHNLGLEHSNSLRCGTSQDMPRVGLTFPGCQAIGYDDLFDVMGYSGTNYGEGNLNAVHLDGMNLLPGSVRRIAASSGLTTVQIPPLSSPLSATTTNRTLKVTDPNGANYFVEYRTNSGRDAVASLNSYRPAWGVRVLRDDPDAAPSAGSFEMDATPTSLSNDYNRSIPVGATFTAASGNLSIKVTAADAAGATLSVRSGTSVPTAPAVPSNVTLSIPAKAWIGDSLTAATVVTDQYGQAKANWTVTLQKMQKGTTTWASLASVQTTSAGAASYRFTNALSGSYRWVSAAATGAPSKVSPSVAVSSIARVTGRAPATTMTSGTYLSLSGTVTSVPAPIVYIQYRYSGGAWVTGPRATVTGTAVSGRIAMTTAGTAYTRLYVRMSTAYTGSISSAYVTTVS